MFDLVAAAQCSHSNNRPSAFPNEGQANGGRDRPDPAQKYLVVGTGLSSCAYHQPLEIGWSCGNLDQGIPGRANWGLSRSILNSTPADRRAASSLCERQDWRQWAGGRPTHTSICNLPGQRCGHMRSVGTPAAVFKMKGNKRSPAHLDWQETSRTPPIHASCGLERLGLPVLRPSPLPRV